MSDSYGAILIDVNTDSFTKKFLLNSLQGHVCKSITIDRNVKKFISKANLDSRPSFQGIVGTTLFPQSNKKYLHELEIFDTGEVRNIPMTNKVVNPIARKCSINLVVKAFKTCLGYKIQNFNFS